MATDLNTLTTGAPQDVGQEIFGPDNAWPGEPAHIYVVVQRVAPDITAQLGFDPGTGKNWARVLKEGVWGEWTELFVPPPPPLPEE